MFKVLCPVRENVRFPDNSDCQNFLDLFGSKIFQLMNLRQLSAIIIRNSLISTYHISYQCFVRAASGYHAYKKVDIRLVIESLKFDILYTSS